MLINNTINIMTKYVAWNGTKNTKAVTAKGSFWQVYVLFRKVNLCCAVYQSINKLQLRQTNKEKFINHVFTSPAILSINPKNFISLPWNQMKIGLAWQEEFLISSQWWYIHQCNCFVSTGLVWWLPLTLYNTSKTIKR